MIRIQSLIAGRRAFLCLYLTRQIVDSLRTPPLLSMEKSLKLDRLRLMQIPQPLRSFHLPIPLQAFQQRLRFGPGG